MNEPGELIADALREIADQAATPRPMADAAWRAGHRRQRLSVIATSAAVAAAATTIAVAVSLGTAGPSAPRHGGGSVAGARGSRSSVQLHSPIQLEQVASTSDKRCAAGADQVPGTAPTACVHLTGTGMTVTDVRSARVQRFVTGGYALDIHLTSADSRVFGALTSELALLHSPHNQLAIIIDGRVLSSPVVETPITAGQIQVVGFTSHAQAERVVWGSSR